MVNLASFAFGLNLDFHHEKWYVMLFSSKLKNFLVVNTFSSF
jgi:hypothetical protein